jgi:hypothetical protein
MLTLTELIEDFKYHLPFKRGGAIVPLLRVCRNVGYLLRLLSFIFLDPPLTLNHTQICGYGVSGVCNTVFITLL